MPCKVSQLPASLGIFGGTFDPVHRGHTTLALALKNHLVLDAMFLMPCHQSPHRDKPRAGDEDRLHMLRLACRDTGLLIDERELKRTGPSYSFDTLRSLRKEHGQDAALVWCMGMDAFAGFHTWYHWDDILSLAHLAVVTRAEYTDSLDPVLVKLLQQHQSTDKKTLTALPAGKIYLTQLDQIPVSSTAIRQQLAQGARLTEDLLHPAVYRYLEERGLYLTR